jgi:hypothetical protein
MLGLPHAIRLLSKPLASLLDQCLPSAVSYPTVPVLLRTQATTDTGKTGVLDRVVKYHE